MTNPADGLRISSHGKQTSGGTDQLESDEEKVGVVNGASGDCKARVRVEHVYRSCDEKKVAASVWLYLSGDAVDLTALEAEALARLLLQAAAFATEED